MVKLPLSEAQRAAVQGDEPAGTGSQLLLFLHRMGIGPSKSLRVLSQNYDQTVSIELPNGNSILGRPAAEAVWLKPDRPNRNWK